LTNNPLKLPAKIEARTPIQVFGLHFGRATVGFQAARGVAIKQARIEGQLLKLRRQAAGLQAQITELESKLAAYRVVLIDVADGEEVPTYPPRAPSKKRQRFSHGEQTRLMLECLRVAQGEWRSTTEILDYMASRKSVAWASMAEREYYRRRIKDALWNRTKRGDVERNSGAREAAPSVNSLWRINRLNDSPLES